MIKQNTFKRFPIVNIRNNIILTLFFITSLFLINCTSINAIPDKSDKSTMSSNLTGPWNLFIDNAFVKSTLNIQRNYHSFEKNKSNPLIEESTPVYLYGTVLKDSEGYSMWYQSYDYQTHFYKIKFLRSSNGISWESIYPCGNVAFQRGHEDHMPQIIYMPWEVESRRYALINFDYGRAWPGQPRDKNKSGYYIAFSHDGIHWKDEKNANPILKDMGDVGSFVYDPHDDKFIAYLKVLELDENGNYFRLCGYSETQDILQWPASEVILRPDEYDNYWVTNPSTQGTEFYGLSAFAYESGYIGFLWIYQNTLNDGPIFIEVVSSQDGKNWNRQEPINGKRSPILELGTNGTWDSGMLFTPNHPLVVNNEIKLYYSGWNATHGKGVRTSAIGLATLRKDGFASLYAGNTPGIITTRLIHSTGEPLHINANAANGEIRVAVYNSEGTPVPEYGLSECNTVTTDSTDIIISWGDKTDLPTGDIYFEITMQNASIYSFALK